MCGCAREVERLLINLVFTTRVTLAPRQGTEGSGNEIGF